MCGRYIFANGHNKEADKFLLYMQSNMKPERYAQVAKYEIYPSCLSFATIYDVHQEHSVISLMTWGTPFQNKQVINARSETCFTSPFFRNYQTCTLPATGYYEWTKNKEKYLFTVNDELIYLAGLCTRGSDHKLHYVILTQAANSSWENIHNRQPLVFDKEKAEAWCSAKDPVLLFGDSIQNRQYSLVK